MANKHKGDLEFTAGGKTYTLRLTVDAICELEGALDAGFAAILDQLSNPHTIRINTARAVLWACLREHHSDLTIREAGELMIEGGGVLKVIEFLNQAVAEAFPPPEPASPNGKADPKTAAGTGPRSMPPT